MRGPTCRCVRRDLTRNDRTRAQLEESERRFGELMDRLEAYIADHSEAQFSHGICPACFAEVEKQFPPRPRRPEIF